jgi:putative methionine-R-sulfoxide reductase with GAF domain
MIVDYPVAIIILDAELRIIEVNQPALDLFNETHKAVKNKLFLSLILRQDIERFKVAWMNVTVSKKNQYCEVRMFMPKGDILFLRLDIGYHETMDNIVIVATDITYKKLIEDTQSYLLSYSWANEKRDFFQSLAEYLSVILKADYVCIDKLFGNQEAETVAVYYNGKFDDNVRYFLKDTPCGKVVGNPVCCFPSSVRKLFPKDLVLQEMIAESYIGITLWGASGKPVGLIAVISRKPLKDTKVSEMILKQVSIRTAAELEYRMHVTKFTALSKSNHAMMYSTSENQLLRSVCRIITKDCDYPLMWIGFADNNEEKSISIVASSGFEQDYLKTLNLTYADVERGRGPTGTAIRTSHITICNNFLTDPKFTPWREQAVKRGYASSAAIPLITDGKAYGAIMVYAREPEYFDEEEIKFLTELANDLSQGITAIRLRTEKKMILSELNSYRQN